MVSKVNTTLHPRTSNHRCCVLILISGLSVAKRPRSTETYGYAQGKNICSADVGSLKRGKRYANLGLLLSSAHTLKQDAKTLTQLREIRFDGHESDDSEEFFEDFEDRPRCSGQVGCEELRKGKLLPEEKEDRTRQA